MAADFAVLYHEPVASIEWQWGGQRAGSLPANAKLGSESAMLRLAAFGRGFVLELRENTELYAKLSSSSRERLAGVQLLAGELVDRPGSWARINLIDGRLSGVFSDGGELYALEPAGSIAPFLVGGTNGDPDRPMIFRWRDVKLSFADLVEPVGSGLAADEESTDPLRHVLTHLKTTLESERGLELALVGDKGFTAHYGSDSDIELLARINIVEGIYAEQVGVFLEVVDILRLDASTDPFTASGPKRLLNQLADFKAADTVLRESDLAHLFTTRSLGDTLGMAYIGAVCKAREGVGFTAVGPLPGGSSIFQDAIVAAHEIGHNLGAPHDGESGSACQAEPDYYVMAPTYNGSDQFSACSLEQIAAFIETAGCLDVLLPNDVRFTLESAVAAVGYQVPFHVYLRPGVSADSLVWARNVRLELNLPPELSVVGMETPSGASCVSIAGEVACTLGDLAPGSEPLLDIVLIAGDAGDFVITGQITAENDNDLGNNDQSLVVSVVPMADLVVEALFPDETLVLKPGETFEVEALVSNQSRFAAGEVRASLYAGPVQALALEFQDWPCAVRVGAPGAYDCEQIGFAPFEARRLTARFLVPEENATLGAFRGWLSVTGTDDYDDTNNTVGRDMRIVEAEFDIAAGMLPVAESAQPGDGLRIDVSFVNHGPDTAPQPEFSVAIGEPALAIAAAQGPGGECELGEAGQLAVCRVTELAAGARFDLTIVVVADVPSAGEIHALVVTDIPGYDTNTGNNLATATVRFGDESLATPAEAEGSATGSVAGSGTAGAAAATDTETGSAETGGSGAARAASGGGGALGWPVLLLLLLSAVGCPPRSRVGNKPGRTGNAAHSEPETGSIRTGMCAGS